MGAAQGTHGSCPAPGAGSWCGQGRGGQSRVTSKEENSPPSPAAFLSGTSLLARMEKKLLLLSRKLGVFHINKQISQRILEGGSKLEQGWCRQAPQVTELSPSGSVVALLGCVGKHHSQDSSGMHGQLPHVVFLTCTTPRVHGSLLQRHQHT